MSVSATVAVPDASEVSSVAPPVVSPPNVAASFTPVMVIVVVWVSEPSALVTTKVSVMVAEAARACTAESVLSRVYVQVPLETPYVPYPLTESVPAETSCRVSSPASGSVTVGVPVAVVESSSVTEPVAAPLIEPASATFETALELIALFTVSAAL